MDNTLLDDSGKIIRPGIEDLLNKLLKKEYELFVWTNSPKARANLLLNDTKLKNYFSGIIAREDYDKENKNLPKDIKRFGFDVLIDDDPAEIKYNKSRGNKAILIKSFRSVNTKLNLNETKDLLIEIESREGLLGKMLKNLGM